MKQTSKINFKIILNASFRLSIFFVTLSCLLTLFDLYKENGIGESIDEKHVYFDLQQESSPFSVPLEKYRELYARLCNDSAYDYYECYLQYLDRLPASLEFFDCETQELTENCQGALCIQISENLQNDSHFECYAGRLLKGEDYQFRGGTIPIILGYEYVDLFQLGSQFTATYLYNVYTFEVVGILEKDSMIQNSMQIIYLDKYIIMPSFNVLELPENTDGIQIHYANKTSGLAVSEKDDFAYVSNDIKQLLSVAECGDYSMNISPVKYFIKGKTGINLEWFIIGLFIAVVISGTWYLKYMKKEKKYITRSKPLFTCAELVSGFLFYAILYILLLRLLILKIDIKTFLICEIFVVMIRNIIFTFQERHKSQNK